MALLERLERASKLYRCIFCFLVLSFAWTLSGCEEKLADLPISETLSLEWGDENYRVSEPILEIPLKKLKVTKKKKKYALSVITKNGDFKGWVIAAELTATLKVKDGQVVGLKKKGSKCTFRYIVDGMPALVKFKLIRKKSEITGAVGEAIAFKLLCRKSKKRDEEGNVYAEGVPFEIWLRGSAKPKWL